MNEAAGGESAARAAERRLRWHCRRGAKELDVMLLRYLDAAWPAAEAAERSAFERLLACQDPDLAAWLYGRARPDDPELLALVGRVRVLSGLPPAV